MLRTKKGFTLIELLIVIAIIGILAAIVIPQVNRFREKQIQEKAKIEKVEKIDQAKKKKLDEKKKKDKKSEPSKLNTEKMEKL